MHVYILSSFPFLGDGAASRVTETINMLTADAKQLTCKGIGKGKAQSVIGIMAEKKPTNWAEFSKAATAQKAGIADAAIKALKDGGCFFPPA